MVGSLCVAMVREKVGDQGFFSDPMKPKRRPPQPLPKLELEEVVGLTTKNASGLASDPSTGVCAYVAGCVAVVFAVDSGARSYLMVSSRPPKPLSCVTLSRGGGGGYVAAGEMQVGG
ncbi:hypothetical protein QJS04_geneDACA007598 [Acorus gramineus]|uniref:Uncharacterized protein n=1 Tax=Acorus gramineus TaxID=55184 RepID=A0AAV9B2J5_ACOGR|nr:hypothetical protein QJS04_geneDACA007598 [Acorus gramineus]